MIWEIFRLFSSLWFLFLHVTGSGSFPRALSAAEERQALEQLQHGDRKARQRLIEHNLRLVAHIAKKYYTEENDRDDLVSIGTIGLIKAIDSFDPRKNVKLSSYASRCIENEILMFFRSARKNAQDVSLNDPIELDKDGNELTLLDTMVSPVDIPAELDRKTDMQRLYRQMQTRLTPREREILCMRYGLSGHSPMVQREVAKRLHISRSYISRIEKKALQKLRSGLEE